MKLRNVVLALSLVITVQIGLITNSVADETGAEKTLEALMQKALAQYKDGKQPEASKTVAEAVPIFHKASQGATGAIGDKALLVETELGHLSARLGMSEVEHPIALRHTFARAHHVLAEFHEDMARTSWLRKEKDKAATQMQIAAENIERSAGWADYKIEGAEKKTVSAMREVSAGVLNHAGETNERVGEISATDRSWSRKSGRKSKVTVSPSADRCVAPSKACAGSRAVSSPVPES